MESYNDTIDVSQYDFPNAIWYMIPTAEAIIKLLTIAPVVLFGVLSNLLLLNIIARNRALQTPTNLLLGNMVAADTVTLLFCPVMFICKDFYQNFVLGALACHMEGYLQLTFLVTAVLNLCAVSYDRLTAIVLPMESRITIRGAKIIMLLTWLVGLTLAIPLAIYRSYRERQWRNFLESFCMENTTFLLLYWHVIITVMVLFPLTVMTICYSTIFWKLDRYEQKVLKRENSISISYKTKVAKMLFIVVVIFIGLHIPFTALIFIRNKLLKNSTMNQVDGGFYMLWYTAHYLLYLNSAVNPIIYGLTNDNFRRAYYQTPLLPRRLRSCLADVVKLLPTKKTVTKSVREPQGQPIVYKRTQSTVINPSTTPSINKSAKIWCQGHQINDNIKQ